MAHLIVHAGFHKTGTTTVQKTLRKNREALRPHAQIVLRPGMRALCEAARGYSAKPDPLALALVTYEAAALAEKLRRNKPVILSSEDLSGHMPGRHGLRTYAATPKLMQTITHAFLKVLPKARIDLYFSTRSPEPWLASCHVQHLRATRMTLSAADYARKYKASANLNKVVDAIEKAAPKAKVHRRVLEQLTDPQGPVAPLLTLANIPQTVAQQITAVPPANAAPPQGQIAALLDLNRSELSEADWKAARLKLTGKTA